MFSPASPIRSPWASRARRALDTAIAFATLADAEPAPHAHPHRRAPRTALAADPRRPGGARPRPQVCLSPIGTRERTPGGPARRVERQA